MRQLLLIAVLGLTACTPYSTVVYPPNVVLTTSVRPHVHAVSVLSDDRLLVRYVPGTVTEVQIVASLQSYCASLGKTAYRAPGATYQETVRSRRGQPKSVLAFTVECR
ncbi:hypothetical protein [Actibacterium lipolyticum]|uniref:Lipoprotein n=1 Tax=Actibacterium lipolyticum TaxID=1524263 RepID=A0A238JR30_9RHOB|nr:hypothetical protein [Actibacterium lipolyticum]SMX32923.1 hypothetical protein COL8621_00920 [Actibacterium lipolyticum]